jgi:hypothetical protein
VIMIRAIHKRAPTPIHDQVAGHFKEEIADEEHPRPKAVYGLAKAKIDLHLELGKADIDAVEVGDDIADHYEGHNASENLRVSVLLDGQGIGYREGRKLRHNILVHVNLRAEVGFLERMIARRTEGENDGLRTEFALMGALCRERS